MFISSCSRRTSATTGSQSISGSACVRIRSSWILLVQATLPPGKRVGLVNVSGSALSPAHLEGAGVPLDTPKVGTENGKDSSAC